MTRTPTNIVSSFFYYMWNKWSEQECLIVFGESGISHHLWTKWCSIANKNLNGAAEGFFAALDNKCRELLVSRALKLYNDKQTLQP